MRWLLGGVVVVLIVDDTTGHLASLLCYTTVSTYKDNTDRNPPKRCCTMVEARSNPSRWKDKVERTVFSMYGRQSDRICADAASAAAVDDDAATASPVAFVVTGTDKKSLVCATC